MDSILFAIAISIDAFAVGLAYGMQGIEIKWDKVWAVSVCSGIMFALAMFCAKLIALFMDKMWLDKIGATLLILLGIYFLGQYYKQNRKRSFGTEDDIGTYYGMVTAMVCQSNYADLDRSGEISIKEAFYLGTMLATDAFSVGISAAWIGVNIYFTLLLIVLSTAALLMWGVRLGAKGKRYSFVGILPGALLIGMGIMNFLVG